MAGKRQLKERVGTTEVNAEALRVTCSRLEELIDHVHRWLQGMSSQLQSESP